MSFRIPLSVWLIAALLGAISNVDLVVGDTVNWRPSIDAAKLEASQSGKLVLLHFWRPSCGPCQMLDRNVFSQPQIGSAVEQSYVPVKINTDISPAWANVYRISQVPSEVVLSPQGNVVATLSCPPTPDAYAAQLANLARNYQQYAAGQQTPNQAPVQAAYAGLKVGDYRNTLAASQAITQTAPPAMPPIAHAMPQQQAGPAVTMNPYAAPSQPQAASSTNNYAQPSVIPPAPALPANAMPSSYRNNSYAAAAPVQAPTSSQVAPPQTTAAQTAPPQAAPSQPVATIAQTWPPQLPAGAPPVGFEGYCPVTLKTARKWVRGDLKYGAIHLGRTYLFAGQQQQQQFLADPNAYSPVFSGKDAVKMLDENQSVEGGRKFGFEYNGSIYLFASAQTRDQFASDPNRYATGVRQAMHRMDASPAGALRR